MFDFFGKRKLQKSIDRKYGRRANKEDIVRTRRYTSSYHNNRFLNHNDYNMLLFIDEFGFVEEIDNGNGDKLLVNALFQKTDSFRSDYYFIDNKYAINTIDKSINDSLIDSYNLPLSATNDSSYSSNYSYSGGNSYSSSSSYSSSDSSYSSSSSDY